MPTRFDPRGVTLRRAGHHGQARKSFGSFPSWVRPIPASRPMSSGLSMCMALPPTEGIANRRLGRSRGHAEVRSGGHPSGTLAAQTVPSRTRSGVFGRPWRTGRPQACPRGSAEPNGDARKTLRTVCPEGHVYPNAYEL